MRSFGGSAPGTDRRGAGLGAGASSPWRWRPSRRSWAAAGATATPPKHGDADAASILDARHDGGVAETPPIRRRTCSRPTWRLQGPDAGAKKAPARRAGAPPTARATSASTASAATPRAPRRARRARRAGSMGTCTFVVAGAKPRDGDDVRRRRRRRPAASTARATARARCRQYTSRARSAAGHVRRRGRRGRARLRRRRAAAGPAPRRSARRSRATRRRAPASSRARRRATARAASSASNGSCGKKMKGANCAKNADCASGFCADGVCCNVACAGGCVSCALTGSRGHLLAHRPRRRPIRAAICIDQGAPRVRHDGHVRRLRRLREVRAPRRSASRRRARARGATRPARATARARAGRRACRTAAPFLCVGRRLQHVVRHRRRLRDAATPASTGLCGQDRTASRARRTRECVSSTASTASAATTPARARCRSCALASTIGQVHAARRGRRRPARRVHDQGAGDLRDERHAATARAAARSTARARCARPRPARRNVYTPRLDLQRDGPVRRARLAAVRALRLQRRRRASTPARRDGNCVTPNVCNGNSCGKKTRGASCSAATECGSTFCAQGVCCDTACTGACQSCALTGTLGTCTNVPTGAPDPAGLCDDQGAASCGTNGKCQAGACQKYATGTLVQGLDLPRRRRPPSRPARPATARARA